MTTRIKYERDGRLEEYSTVAERGDWLECTQLKGQQGVRKPLKINKRFIISVEEL